MWMGSYRYAPVVLPPGNKSVSHCTGGWVGPRDGVERVRKILTTPGFDPRTSHPVASRYTD